MKEHKKLQELIQENEQLRIRVQEAEETIEAIRAGAVDAVVVQGPKGEQIFTLSGEEVVYQRLVETMNEAGLTVTPDGVVLFCNQRFGKMIGKSPEEILGRPLRHFVAVCSHGDLGWLLREVQVRPFRHRLVFRNSDGSPVPARVSANVLRQGDFVSVCLVATDMTELEESEEVIRQINEQRDALRDAHQRLTLAVGAGHIGLFDWHIREDRIYCTGEHEAIYGYPAENGEDVTTVVYSYDDLKRRTHPEDVPHVQEELQHAMEERRNYHAEHRVLWADGTVHWVDSRAVLHYDESGNAVRMVGAIRDITERKSGEDALRASEEKYRTLFDAMDEAYCIIEMIFDEDGKATDYRFVEVNPSFERHAGFKAGRGKCMREISPEHEEYWFEIYGRVVKTGQAVRFEQRAEQMHRWYDVYAFRYGEPEDRQVAVLFNDITGRKRAEEALRESEARYRRLVETANEGIWEVDRGYHTTYVNRRMAEMLGYEVAEIIGRPVSDFLFAESAAEMDRRAERRRRGIAETYEIAAQRKDGSGLWLLVSAAPLRDEKGVFYGSFAMVTDISERKRGEEVMAQQRELLQRVFDSIPVLLVMWDARLERLSLNKHAERVLGWTTEDANAGDFTSKVYPDPAYRAAVEAYMQSLEPGWREWNARAKDGQTVAIDWANIRLSDQTRVGIGVDLRERKEAEANLRRLNDSLEQLVRDRTSELHYKNLELERRAEQLSRFASEITLAEQRERHRLAKVLHDHLQQLLVAAKLGLQGLGQSMERREHTDAIYDIYELIKQSIEASRSLTVELSPTILHDAGLPAGLEWLSRWMQKKHGLVVDLQVEEDADTGREDIRILMFESVRELLFNIVKHAGVTHAEVRLARRGDNIEIVVIDEGMGFDPERLGEMGGESGGFGLFSIRERLELLGGGLEIESRRHGGSRFTLTAPAAQGERLSREESGREREREAAEAAAEEEGRQAMVRVLIVDDHKVIRQGMAARLRREPDIEIAGEAGNGEEAIAKAHELRPDVILMDFNMPRMDGVEATQRIHAELPEIRIIGLSMYEEADRARAMLDAGAHGYVTKSAELDDLLAAIRAAEQAA